MCMHIKVAAIVSQVEQMNPEELNQLQEAIDRRRRQLGHKPLKPASTAVERRSMRRGDLLGLNWDDVDLEAATVRVHRPLTRTDNGRWLALGEPKTKKSRHTICLAQVAVEFLRGHLERQLREIEACGGGQAGVARAAGITAPKVW
jgi:integrase